MSRAYHVCGTTSPVGSSLVPVFFRETSVTGKVRKRFEGIYFHEDREMAMRWSRPGGMVLYSCDLEVLRAVGARPHWDWVGVWVLRQPIALAMLDEELRRDGPDSFPEGSREALESAALACGVL